MAMEEAKTNRGLFSSLRQAATRALVPSTLMSQARASFLSEAGGITATRWITASGPPGTDAKARSRSAADRMSPVTILQPFHLPLRSAPSPRPGRFRASFLSKIVTSWPASRQAATALRPTLPKPPVTRICIPLRSLRHSYQYIMNEQSFNIGRFILGRFF